MKLQLKDSQKETLEKFLTPNVEAIIQSELDTYKTTGPKSQNPRVYIFSTFSVGIAELKSSNSLTKHVIQMAIDQFQDTEMTRLPEEHMEHYERAGNRSHITAILVFGVASALTMTREEAEEKGIATSIINGEASVHEIIEKFAHLAKDVLTIQYTSPFHDYIRTYQFIEHDGEVLDIPLLKELDIREELTHAKEGEIGGDMLTLSDLLQVE